MLFWHLGATIALARYAFRDDRMDLRMLMLGAILPDLIDTPIGLIFFDRLQGVRLFTHGLLVASIVMIGVVFFTRRGRPRKLWMPLAIGLLFHLLLDAMWLDPETLWWPFLGWSFTAAGPATAAGFVAEVLGDWRTWLAELVGLVYLVYLWRAADLSDTQSRRAFLNNGRIDVPIDG
ncbi:MAG: metal-dependent hydrolase [Acidimicrobiia bacterium]|nr:metal-dependent hydrolase [Acidimicrobiia bacterium]